MPERSVVSYSSVLRLKSSVTVLLPTRERRSLKSLLPPPTGSMNFLIAMGAAVSVISGALPGRSVVLLLLVAVSRLGQRLTPSRGLLFCGVTPVAAQIVGNRSPTQTY